MEIGSRGDTGAVFEAEAALRAATESARAEVREVNGPLRRTHMRGVYRTGDTFVVRVFDEVGIEHLRRFRTRREAHAFSRAERIREKHQTDYAGTSFGPR